MTRTLKIEDDKSGATKFKYTEIRETGFQSPLGLVSSTQRFFFHAHLPSTHPWVKKCHLITGIGTGYRSHDK